MPSYSREPLAERTSFSQVAMPYDGICRGGAQIALAPEVLLRAANSKGPGGPTGPLRTPSRAPGALSGLTRMHRTLSLDPLTLASGTFG